MNLKKSKKKCINPNLPPWHSYGNLGTWTFGKNVLNRILKVINLPMWILLEYPEYAWTCWLEFIISSRTRIRTWNVLCRYMGGRRIIFIFIFQWNSSSWNLKKWHSIVRPWRIHHEISQCYYFGWHYCSIHI